MKNGDKNKCSAYIFFSIDSQYYLKGLYADTYLSLCL